MPWGVAIGAGISAVGSLASGAMQSSAISGAADKAAGISQQAIKVAQDAYGPYTTTGTNALGNYANLLGINGPDAAAASRAAFTASPGYGYQVEQGLRAVDAGAAAKGMLRSGATLKAEQTLGSNLANLDFGNYLGRLNSLAGMGLNATQGVVGAITGQANNQQQIATQAGTQQASIYGNMVQGVTGAAQNAFGSGALNGLFSNGGISGSPFSGAGLTVTPTTFTGF